MMTLSELINTPSTELCFYNYYLTQFRYFMHNDELGKFHNNLSELVSHYKKPKNIKARYVMIVIALFKSSPRMARNVLRECVSNG